MTSVDLRHIVRKWVADNIPDLEVRGECLVSEADLWYYRGVFIFPVYNDGIETRLFDGNWGSGFDPSDPGFFQKLAAYINKDKEWIDKALL